MTFLPGVNNPAFPATPLATRDANLQPWLETGLFPARAAGLRDHAAGPAVQQCHVGEVHRLGNRAGASRRWKTR